MDDLLDAISKFVLLGIGIIIVMIVGTIIYIKM